VVAHFEAELEHQRGFAAADRTAHPNGEGAPREIAMERLIAFVEMAGVIERFVGVAVRAVIVIVLMMVVAHGKSGLKKA
jgi:hypothetical protein